MKTLRTLILLCIALALTSPASARDWLRAETPRFVIYSDGYPLELKRWALKLENFDALLKAKYGGAKDPPGSKLTVYLLKDEKAVSRLIGQKNLNGFYSASSEGSFAIASRRPAYYKNTLSGQMTLFHEYGHHFMYRHFTDAYPVWYSEGFAEYVSTVAFDSDWRPSFALPSAPRLKYLRDNPLPIRTILTASVEDFKPGQRARFYAWSWKLVHMLNAPGGTRRDQLARYLELYARGAPSIEAATLAFGDLDRLESDLQSYEASGSAVLPFAPLKPDGLKIAVMQLRDDQSQLVDLRLDRLVGQSSNRTREDLRTLARQYPGNADIQLEVALSKRDAAIKGQGGNFEAAERAAGRALALAPGSARVVAVWADLELRRIKRDPASVPTDWVRVRRRLMTAIRHDRGDPLALMTYYRSFVNEPIRPTAMAYRAMQAAFALQPESVEIRLSQIYSLSLQGRLGEAKVLAHMLASDPHASELGERTLASLTKIESAGASDTAKAEKDSTAAERR